MNRDEDLYGRTIMWRETMRTPSFFLLDAHCIFVLPLFLFHKRWWTFAVLLVTVLSFAAMRLFQYRPSSAVRAFRSVLAGPLRQPFGDSRLRPGVDYGFEYRIEGKKSASDIRAHSLFVADVPRAKLHAFAGFFECAEHGRNKNHLSRLLSQ